MLFIGSAVMPSLYGREALEAERKAAEEEAETKRQAEERVRQEVRTIKHVGTSHVWSPLVRHGNPWQCLGSRLRRSKHGCCRALELGNSRILWG